MLKIVSNMKLIKHIIYIGVILLSSCTTLYELDNKRNNIISVSATPDSLITSIIAPYKVGIDSVMNEVLCISDIEMTKGKPESLLGNFVTDLCLEMCMKDLYNSRTTNSLDICMADVCIMNNGGLRSTLPKGKITKGMIYELMPFENELVILELNVSEIFELVEYIYSRGEPFSGLNIYSLDSIEIIDSKDILHRKNNNITVWMYASDCRERNYIPLGKDDINSYTLKVLTSDYLANGGDKMSFFNNKNQLKVGLKIRDAIINYCKSEQTISSKLDGRLEIISDEK